MSNLTFSIGVLKKKLFSVVRTSEGSVAGIAPPLRQKEGESVAMLQKFHTAERTLKGIESINMIRKGQVKRLARNDVQGQAKFVESLFGIAA